MVADVLLLLSANIFAVAFAVFFVVSALTSLKRIQRVALSAVLALATASHQLLLSYGYYHSDNIPIVFFYLTTYLTNAVFFLAPLALIIVCGFVLVGVVRLINKYTPANINIYAIPLLSRFIQRFEHMTYAKECEEERLRQERQLRINPYLALPVNKNDLLGTTGAFNSNADNSNKAVKANANANTVYSSTESKPRKTPMKTQNRIYSDLHMTNEAHENKIMMQRAERAAANAAAAAEAAAAAAESMADNTEAMTPEKRKAAVRAYAIRHAKAKIQTQEQVLNPEDAMLEDEPHALEQHAFYSAADFDRKAVMKKAADAAATADAAARAQIRARAEQATRDLDNPQRFLVPNTDIKFNHSETTGVGADESTSYTIATPNNSYNEFNLDWDDLIERSKDGKTVRKRKEVVYAAQQAQDAVDRNAAFAAAHPNKNDPNAKSTRFNAPDGTPFPRELPKRQDRDGTYITTEMANEYLDTKYHTFLTNRMPLPTLSELLHLKKRYQSDYDCDLEQFDVDGLDGNTTVAKAKAKAEASAAAIATAGAAGASAGASAVTDTAAGSDTTTTDHGSNHKHPSESLGSKLLHEISLPYRYIHELGHHHATLPHPAVEGLTHEEKHTLSHAANEPIFINDSESHTPDNEQVKRRVNKDAPQKVHDDSKISTEPQVDATAATADASVTVDASDEVMVEEQLPPGVSEAIDKSDPLYAYESTTGNKVNIYTASDLQEFDDEELANFRQRLRAKVKAITLNTVRGVGLVLCTAALICAGYSTAQVITQPDTKTITLSLDVPENFDGMRIMQLSDLHISPMTSRSSLAGLVMRIMQMRPDMIVLTGDISTGEPWVMKDTLKPLFMLNAPLGIYSIPGNDDYKMHFQHYLSMYKDNDFDILLNESRTIDCFGSKMTVIGIADESAAENGYFLQPYTQISVDDDSTFNLVITHKPNHARLYQKNDHQNSDLILTGSTTAGQINVFKNMVARANNGFINGLYQLSGSSLLYVSAGSGVNPALPIRYGSESEITLITIHSSRIDHNLSTPELDESHFLQRHYNTPKEVPQNFIQNQEPNFDNYDLSIQNFTAYAPQQPPRMQPRMSPAPTMQQHPLTNRH